MSPAWATGCHSHSYPHPPCPHRHALPSPTACYSSLGTVGCPPAKEPQENRGHHSVLIVAPSDAALAVEPEPELVPVLAAVVAVAAAAWSVGLAEAAKVDEPGAGHAHAAGRALREQDEGTASDEVAVAAGGDAS